MTDTHDGPAPARTPGPLDARWEALASKPNPPTPPGTVGKLANRMLVYARPNQVPAVLPLLDEQRGGLVIAGKKATTRTRLLGEAGFDGIVLTDPAAYEGEEGYLATPEAPFFLPQD